MDSNTILMSLESKLPKDMTKISMLKEQIDKLDEKGKESFLMQVQHTKLKNPTMVFWVGAFLFGTLGVNRFMLGDVGKGIAKLALYIFAIIFLVIGSLGALGSILESGMSDSNMKAYEKCFKDGIKWNNANPYNAKPDAYWQEMCALEHNVEMICDMYGEECKPKESESSMFGGIALMVFAGILQVASLVWFVVDLFIAGGKRAREMNYQSVSNILKGVK